MRTSPAGIAFIETQEGFSASIYDDNGHPAIGFGHDLQPGEQLLSPLTRTEAEQLLSQDLSTRFEPCLNSLIPEGCTQNQFDALVDFAYNEGCKSLAVLLSHGWDQVVTQLPRWCYETVKGVLVKDSELLARRLDEADLFQK
jgi:lysozyme